MKIKNYHAADAFCESSFQTPPQPFAPVYNWMWNGPVTPEETEKQLDEMLRLGIKGVCIVPLPKSFRPFRIPTLMEPDYLTPPYFEAYKYAVESAKKRNMHMWFYDEGGWPSGGACGRLMLEHPEFAQQSLKTRTVEYKKGDVYTQKEDVAAAFNADFEQINAGYVFETDASVTEYYAHKRLFEVVACPEVPDATVREATDTFIEMTHEAYKPYLEEFFGDTLLTVFTDEPTGPRELPYRKEIEALFVRENDYSFVPYLPEINGDKPATEKGVQARIAWFDLSSRLFCENFMLPAKAWSNAHNMPYTGHMDLDHYSVQTCAESGNYNIMRALRCFDLPGVDVIWRQIFPYRIENPLIAIQGCQKGDGNGFFPRYASSAASQIGSKYAITESFGVYGAGLTFDQMRYVLNYQAVRGVNLYNIFGVPYYREGFMMGGELPFFTEKHACYADLPVFNKYAERLSYLASLGEAKNNVGLYMPIHDLCAGQKVQAIADAFEAIGMQLENDRILFDIIDDDVFTSAAADGIKAGKLIMGSACYTTVVVPPCKYMDASSKAVLADFIAGGGRVIEIDGTEAAGIAGAEAYADITGILTAPIALSGDTQLVRLGMRKAENGTLYMLFNEATESRSFTAHFGETVYVLDAENGKIVKPILHEDGVLLTLQSGQMAFLWSGDVSDAKDTAVYENEIELTSFTFRRTKRFTIDEMQCFFDAYFESEKPLALGDWSVFTGEDFSGSGVYKTTFKAPAGAQKLCLDLGEVWCSCEVFLNGESLGVLAMSPYAIELPTEKLHAENVLEIRVTNTAANEFLHTKSFDKWQPWQLTGYMPIEEYFHKDSLHGGLYGPVKLKY